MAVRERWPEGCRTTKEAGGKPVGLEAGIRRPAFLRVPASRSRGGPGNASNIRRTPYARRRSRIRIAIAPGRAAPEAVRRKTPRRARSADRLCGRALVGGEPRINPFGLRSEPD